jgi:hypothetical protein
MLDSVCVHIPIHNQQGRVRRDGTVTVTPQALQPYLNVTATNAVTATTASTAAAAATATAACKNIEKHIAVTAR